MSPLRIIGPASIAVCISSPVRSRKPVLMNATRLEAAAMQAFRLTLVRRSSSMMPSLTVLSGRPSSCSTRAEQLAGEGHLGRPVHLGLDDVDRALAAVADAPACPALQVVQRDRGGDHRVEDAFGNLLSVGRTGSPGWSSGGRRCARTAASGRAAALRRRPARVYTRSGFRPRVKVLPPLATCPRSACPSGCRASCRRPAPCRRHRPRPPSLRGRGWSTAPTRAPGR